MRYQREEPVNIHTMVLAEILAVAPGYCQAGNENEAEEHQTENEDK
jgi:hypothetical protein